ncbi:DUF421 domain-containing protein [Acidovorax sp. NCPPB 4044]|uniref:DUF421 domain-containing protein n=1 Tax=Acidovorax sp. NCPPB 4044 TaxID=2940490 RepID=UPI0023032693|nr:YetF domain-containing protein [Acidovorax sp. NCPPB 4044]MDA8521940.1 hypothetical protein [Acidovorax sp. NCPPB 4044]
MWNLEVDWIELVLRGVLVYVALLAMLRISGKRTLGQFTPFDLLVIMLLSEAASNSMTGGDQSLPGGLLVCAVLIALNVVAGFLSARSRTVEAVLEGEAVLVGRDGRVFHNVLRRHRISRNDWEKALREADCEESSIRLAFLEADGSIVIQQARGADAEK